MATAEDWANGFLRQARVELDASRADVTESVRAMLPQMVYEKIAKAALLRSGQWTVELAQTTHLGASHMMQLLCNRRLREQLSVLEGRLRNSLKPLVDELEGLQPKVARDRGRTSGPWLEYPWEAPKGVTTPAESLPNLERYGARRAPTVRLLTDFAAELIEKHEQLFG